MPVSRIVAALALLLAVVVTATAQPGGQVFTPSPGYYPGTAKFDSLCLDTTNQDACLARDAADTLAQRRTTNPQAFYLYNTFTSLTNLEALGFGFSSGNAVISTSKGSGGGSNRNLTLLGNSVIIRTGGSNTYPAFNGGSSAATFDGSTATFSQPVNTTAYQTATRCANTGSPAVCAAAAAGSVVIAAAAASVVVNTTIVTANSQIFAMIDRSLGTLLSVTCDTTSDLTTGSPAITARVAATSFTIAVPVAPAANPMCLSYFIVN